MSYTRLRDDAPSRGINDMEAGDFVKIGSTWKQIESVSGNVQTNPKGDWSVRTTDSGTHSGWGINRYAKAGDLEER